MSTPTLRTWRLGGIPAPIAGAILALAVLAATIDSYDITRWHPHPTHPLLWAALTVVLVGVVAYPRKVAHGPAYLAADLAESLFVPLVLLCTPTQVLGSYLVANLAAQLVARRPWYKAIFNVANSLTVTGVGLAFVQTTTSPGAPLSDTVFLAVSAGLLVATLSHTITSAIIAATSQARLRDVLTANWRTNALAWTGSLGLWGLATVALARDPGLLPLCLAPVLFLQAAYAATVAEYTRRVRAENLTTAAAALRTHRDPASVLAAVTTHAPLVAHAIAADLLAADAPGSPGTVRAPLSADLHVQVSAPSMGRSFTSEDTEALTAFAAIAGDALRTADLYTQLRSITDAQTEAVMALDGTGTITFANPAAHTMLTGADRRRRAGAGIDVDLAGTRVDEHAVLLTRDHPGARAGDTTSAGSESGQRLDLVGLLAAGTAVPDLPATLTRTDGTSIPVTASLTPLASAATAHQARHATAVIVLRDVSERAAFEARLAHQAHHDELTGLANRRLLFEHVDAVLAASRAGRHALLFFDLDRFKLVNDSFGHLVGDALLVQVVERLRTHLHPADLLARWGGDEFVVFRADTDTASAVALGEKLLGALGDPFPVAGTQVYVTVSVGVAMTAPGVDRERLIADADAAAYQAKETGRARVVVHQAGSAALSRDALELESDMHTALAQGRFTLHYQPIVDTVTGAVTGTEALIRWLDPERGMIGPDKFIPLAEETGLILPMGRWALTEACRQTQAWNTAHPDRAPLTVSVNLSGRQFARADITTEVADVLATTCLPAHLLYLEITETVLMDDAPSTQATIDALSALGVKVAIDDFGTGYSSLSYLKRFPVSRVKIDREFVGGLGCDNVDTEIVTAVVRLARAVGLDVVAEGVETEDQLAALAQLGCAHVQGYLKSRPLPAEKFPGYWDTALPTTGDTPAALTVPA